MKKSEVKEVPIWEKYLITVEEAAAYTHIGVNTIRRISGSENCPFVLWVGNKRLIKRKLFTDYLDRQYSV